jgi:hypothetical protein
MIFLKIQKYTLEKKQHLQANGTVQTRWLHVEESKYIYTHTHTEIYFPAQNFSWVKDLNRHMKQ